jgi:hypothetical protein
MMTGTYERIAQTLLHNQPRPKPFCRFENDYLHVGTQSLHRTPASRMWRTFWRMKINRLSRSNKK